MSDGLEKITWGSGETMLTNADGGQIDALGLRYNASISALEVRAMVEMLPGAVDLVTRIGKGPLRLAAAGTWGGVGYSHAWSIAFESATLAFPCEIEGGGLLCEVVVLRGLRVERV